MNVKKQVETYDSFINKPFILLFVYNILFSISYGMAAPILVGYITGKGISGEMAGVVAGVVSIVSLVIRPLSGHFTDRLNQKLLLVSASSLMGVAMVCMAFAESVPMMLISRICQGVGFALNGTCCIAMASRYMPKARLSEGVGYFGVANIISSSVAPALGIELSTSIGYQNTFFVSGAAVIGAALCMISFRYYEKKSEESLGTALVSAMKNIKPGDLFAVELLPMALLVAAFSFANSIVATYLASVCQERGIEHYSIYFTINAIVMVVARPFLGRAADRWGLSVVLYPAYIITAAAMLLIGNCSVLWMILLASVLKALGQGCGQPAIQAECLKKLGAERRGVATSTFYVGSDVANGVAPVVGGFIAEGGGYSSVFSFGAVILIAAFVGYAVYARRTKITA